MHLLRKLFFCANFYSDTAANAGVLELLKGNTVIPVALQTASASFVAALWRVFLMPLQVLKNNLQAHGARGLPSLRFKVVAEGGGSLAALKVFFRGSTETYISNLVGHYPCCHWMCCLRRLRLH
mmetsp:Transcript_1662/g.2012  ORF Transcript_1662/g.2012 Transcript_1662/m.2012 type:complete len:124 (-) Transcript_1662:589-960(-)